MMVYSAYSKLSVKLVDLEMPTENAIVSQEQED